MWVCYFKNWIASKNNSLELFFSFFLKTMVYGFMCGFCTMFIILLQVYIFHPIIICDGPYALASIGRWWFDKKVKANCLIFMRSVDLIWNWERSIWMKSTHANHHILWLVAILHHQVKDVNSLYILFITINLVFNFYWSLIHYVAFYNCRFIAIWKYHLFVFWGGVCVCLCESTFLCLFLLSWK